MSLTHISMRRGKPAAYRKARSGLEQQTARSGLEKFLVELVRPRASQINGCAKRTWTDAKQSAPQAAITTLGAFPGGTKMLHCFQMMALTLCFLLSPTIHAQQPEAGAKIDAKQSSITARIDALFAAWDKPNTPGGALAVIKDGQIIYSHGYGMADLERGAPNTPATIFHVASMSKQFTAFAVHLLVQDGKLSLDDDVRKYLPELHDYGQTITIRHLLHHTSGLRDQWNLLALAGWRLDDVITEDDILQLLWRQKDLNFAPGAEFLYSNTGYTLLGVIVKRVSGMSLPAFTHERMFKPLGMQNTHFHDDYQSLVKGRASSYVQQPGGEYQYVALSYSNVGATSLFTTVEDLALWDQNFYDGRVGGKEMLAQMQVKGKLNSGKTIAYASGLVIGKYRGLSTVEHAGGDAGFRTDMLRFPDQHLSVTILSNAGDMNPSLLAQKVADIVLHDVLAPAPVEPKKQEWVAVQVDPKLLGTLVGDYALSPDFVITFTQENGQLMSQATGQDKFPVFAGGGRTFFAKVFDAQFTFGEPGNDGVVTSGVLHQHGRDMPAKRATRAPVALDELNARAGEFYSDELHVLYTLTQRDGKLLLRHPRGEVTLNQSAPDAFSANFPIGKIQFKCGTNKSCNGFTLSNGRVRNLQFSRIVIEPAIVHQTANDAAMPSTSEQPRLPPIAALPIYLRGSMNEWGLRDRMQALGHGKFEAKMLLDPGRHEFKVGSEDFSTIDFGAVSGDESTAVSKSRKMEVAGENFSIDVPQRAAYTFTFDASDPLSPLITVKSTEMTGK